MESSVFVVSDLHLGGAPGVQMCSAAGQQRLAQLFEWIAGQCGSGRRIDLVIAGDIVDFLAVEDQDGGTWSAFTLVEDEALWKLEKILAWTAPIWDALARCVERGCSLTMMLGNHDIELSLPKLRRRLRERLGPGDVEFLCDNEAYTRGRLLIEHGNRYEGWNVVHHDALRRARSVLSRGGKLGSFPVQPGSDLVAKVINKLKVDYSWIDLLKPETSGLIPLLAVVGGEVWREFGPTVFTAARAAWRDRQFGGDAMPTEDSFIAEPVRAAAPDDGYPDADIEAWLAAHLGNGNSQIAGERGGLRGDLVFAALRKWGEKDGRSFRVEREDPRYLDAAATLARRGYEVVVFGHTHHVKRVALPGRAHDVYFNTGTWADLIRVPSEVFDDNEVVARPVFDTFFEELTTNQVDRIRRLLPTFARIDFDASDAITHKDVYFFDGPDRITPVTTDDILRRLA